MQALLQEVGQVVRSSVSGRVLLGAPFFACSGKIEKTVLCSLTVVLWYILFRKGDSVWSSRSRGRAAETWTAGALGTGFDYGSRISTEEVAWTSGSSTRMLAANGVGAG